jgi:hypothetical protein
MRLEKVSRAVFSRHSLRKLHDQALAKRRKALETNHRKAGHIPAGQILPFELADSSIGGRIPKPQNKNR